jgi:hypothetical protein
MNDTTKAVLEGGPRDLPERIVALAAPEVDLKIELRNGYEHFRRTARQADTAEGTLPVYEWWERTEMPG